MRRGDSLTWEAVYPLLSPQINADGVHEWHFDPSFPIDLRLFIANGCESIRMNRHPYLELMYICEGTAELKVQERSFQVGPGDLVVVGADIYHGLIVGRTLKLMALYFDSELIRTGDTTGEHIEYLTPFLIQGPQFPHVIDCMSAVVDEVRTLLERIHAELPVSSNQAKICVKTYLKMILVLLMKHYAEYRGSWESLERKQRAFSRLRPVFRYIEQNYSQVVRVREAARLCGMSNSHLMWFFKQTTGQSFLTYVTHFRIAKAQALLAETDLSISDIGQEVGFCDQSHFGLAFRKLLGTTPLAFRHQFQTHPTSPAMRELVARNLAGANGWH